MDSPTARLRADMEKRNDGTALVWASDLRAVLATLDGATAREAALMEALTTAWKQWPDEHPAPASLVAAVDAALSNVGAAAEALLARLAAAERERDRLRDTVTDLRQRIDTGVCSWDDHARAEQAETERDAAHAAIDGHASRSKSAMGPARSVADRIRDVLGYHDRDVKAWGATVERVCRERDAALAERDRLQTIERHVVEWVAWNTIAEPCDCGDCFECDVRPMLGEKVAARVEELEKNHA